MGIARDILISTDSQETRVAITEDGRLEEYYVERASDTRMVGSIYKGRVTSIVPGIGAAFIDIGLEKNGFLYVADIVEPKAEDEAILDGEATEGTARPSAPPRDRHARIDEILKLHQEILVQVVKEPFGTKGARLTTHISLPGRYMVLMGHDARCGVSKRIVVDSKPIFRSLRNFLQMLIPGVKVRLDLYTGTEPLFEQEGVEAQIASLFDRRVQLHSGGSIVVEPTESVVAIDVNTAKFTGRRNLEETAFQVDKEAAVEVARQLRLRDIGGIIIIDFIDLDVAAHRRELVTVLEQALARDRAKTNLISFSEICVAELTRQRMRRSVETVSSQVCPYCAGRGKVKSSLTVAIEAIRQAKRALKDVRQKTLELLVHPDVAVRLLQEDRPSLSALEAVAQSKILVLSDPTLHIEQVTVTLRGD